MQKGDVRVVADMEYFLHCEFGDYKKNVATASSSSISLVLDADQQSVVDVLGSDSH